MRKGKRYIKLFYKPFFIVLVFMNMKKMMKNRKKKLMKKMMKKMKKKMRRTMKMKRQKKIRMSATASLLYACRPIVAVDALSKLV